MPGFFEVGECVGEVAAQGRDLILLHEDREQCVVFELTADAADGDLAPTERVPGSCARSLELAKRGGCGLLRFVPLFPSWVVGPSGKWSADERVTEAARAETVPVRVGLRNGCCGVVQGWGSAADQSGSMSNRHGQRSLMRGHVLMSVRRVV